MSTGAVKIAPSIGLRSAPDRRDFVPREMLLRDEIQLIGADLRRAEHRLWGLLASLILFRRPSGKLQARIERRSENRFV